MLFVFTRSLSWYRRAKYCGRQSQHKHKGDCPVGAATCCRQLPWNGRHNGDVGESGARLSWHAILERSGRLAGGSLCVIVLFITDRRWCCWHLVTIRRMRLYWALTWQAHGPFAVVLSEGCPKYRGDLQKIMKEREKKDIQKREWNTIEGRKKLWMTEKRKKKNERKK